MKLTNSTDTLELRPRQRDHCQCTEIGRVEIDQLINRKGEKGYILPIAWESFIHWHQVAQWCATNADRSRFSGSRKLRVDFAHKMER